MHKQLQIICAMVAACALLPAVMTQRPFFAGSRPTHNQKDKYNANQNPDIVNRFGTPSDSSSTTTTTVTPLAFGAPQRPPQGLPVVMPHPVYVPIPSTVQAPVPQFSVDNRLGGTDIQTPSASPAAAFPAASSWSGLLPLDAHGDQLLVDQLNSLPEDNRPFWFLNYQAIEAQRNGTAPTLGGPISSKGSFAG